MTVEGVIAQGFGSWVGYKQDASSADNEKLFDDKFILRDNASRSIANAAYAIERATGMFEYGETDGSGHTFMLTTTVAAENIKFHLAG